MTILQNVILGPLGKKLMYLCSFCTTISNMTSVCDLSLVFERKKITYFKDNGVPINRECGGVGGGVSVLFYSK